MKRVTLWQKVGRRRGSRPGHKGDVRLARERKSARAMRRSGGGTTRERERCASVKPVGTLIREIKFSNETHSLARRLLTPGRLPLAVRRENLM